MTRHFPIRSHVKPKRGRNEHENKKKVTRWFRSHRKNHHC